MTMSLEDKTVLVSGVGAGLGRAIVACSLREGANVVMAARTEARLRSFAEALDPGAERVAYRRTDVSRADDCQAVVDLSVDRFGGVDAVVHCAAAYHIGGLLGADLDEWNALLESNVVGAMRLTQASAPVLQRRGGGSIVFIGSQTMFWPQVIQTAYAASKGALMAASYSLARELGPAGIRVNTVVPTWMWGPAVEEYVATTAQREGVSQSEVIGRVTQRMPLGRIPSDDDVAEAVIFFASDRARSISGQALLVNAGEFFR